MTFIYTKGGHVNLDYVRKARERNGELILYDDDGQTVTGYGDLEQMIIQLIPTGEPFDLLTIVRDTDGSNPEVFSKPVVCWALTADGRVRPVGADLDIPSENNPWALRRRGTDTVFDIGLGTFNHHREWLAEEVEEASEEASESVATEEKQDAGI